MQVQQGQKAGLVAGQVGVRAGQLEGRRGCTEGGSGALEHTPVADHQRAAGSVYFVRAQGFEDDFRPDSGRVTEGNGDER